MPPHVMPRAEKWYGVEKVDPNFYVDCELFQYAGDDLGKLRCRQKKVSGAVWKVGGRDRDDLVVLTDINPDRVADVRNPTFGIAGHLMAAMLTGVDDPYNLVPVSKATNDKMGAIERDIGGSLSPRWLEIEISGYHDESGRDGRVPKQFIYKLYASHEEPKSTDAPLKVYPPVVQDWLQMGQYSLPQKMVTRAAQLKLGLSFGWKIEDCAGGYQSRRDLRFLKPYLPPVDKRPLAFLDYWLICYNGLATVPESDINNYVDSIALSGGFGEWARQFAIQGNVLANNNWLISDTYGKKEAAVATSDGVVTEQHMALIAGGGLNGPHVDHIVPASLNGPNCFSNAQITSMQYNVQKGNQTKAFEYRDDKWKEEMLKKLTADPKLQKFL